MEGSISECNSGRFTSFNFVGYEDDYYTFRIFDYIQEVIKPEETVWYGGFDQFRYEFIKNNIFISFESDSYLGHALDIDIGVDEEKKVYVRKVANQILNYLRQLPHPSI